MNKAVKVMKRNSTCEPAFRKLPVDVRQWKEHIELALELPPEFISYISIWYNSRRGRKLTVTGVRHYNVPVRA